jgi:DNA mismatch repair protein MutS
VADRSYGIHVARLAGLPGPVVDRASELLQAFEERSLRESEALELRGTPELEWKETKATKPRKETNEETGRDAVRETSRTSPKKKASENQGQLFR